MTTLTSKIQKPSIKVDMRIFNSCYRVVAREYRRHVWIYGGASGGKSNFVAHHLVLRALAGEAVLIARETQVSLRKSVWLEVRDAIQDMGLYTKFSQNKTELTFTSKVSLGSIQMVGCDSEDNIKSIKPLQQKGFTKLWLEEVNQISKSMLIQLNMRCRGKVAGGFKKQTFYTWNPTFEQHYINQDFLLKIGWNEDDTFFTDKNNMVLRTTYKDNDYLSAEDIAYLEGLAELSEYHARVYLDGKWGVLGENCFEKIGTCARDEVPEYLPWYAGMDFGWSDPTAFTLMKVDDDSRIIYVIDGFSDVKQDHVTISTKVKAKFKSYGINRGQPIYCDSEDPRLITQIRAQGLNSRDAQKPSGSVLNGIMIINTYTIVICEEFTKGVEAVNNYKWVEDQKTGKPTDKPSHLFSHIPDSIRYGLEPILQGFVKTTGGRRS